MIIDLQVKYIRRLRYWKHFLILFVGMLATGFIFGIEKEYLIYALGTSFLTTVYLYSRMKNMFEMFRNLDDAMEYDNKKRTSKL